VRYGAPRFSLFGPRIAASPHGRHRMPDYDGAMSVLVVCT